MKGNMSEKGYCSLHAIVRAKERYNTKINKAKAKRIVDTIRRKRCKELHTDKNGYKIFLVHFRNHYYKLVFDHGSETIVTFLPLRESDIVDE